MVADDLIDIAPEYQRHFRWKADRQSALVESVLLGIPIPSIFTAANADGTWELIDGVQRLNSLIHFVGDADALAKVNFDTSLVLQGLNKLTLFNGFSFQELPTSIQRQLQLKPLKVTTISDKSDRSVRFDLFERLNTGGIVLTPQEIRACVYRGRFNELLRELAESAVFHSLIKLPDERKLDGTQEEFVLKYFAYLNNYASFQHSVIDFLTTYMADASEDFDYRTNERTFYRVFETLAEVLPNGIVRGNRGQTPVNLFEAVTVGAALALHEQGRLNTANINEWLESEELRRLTTGATNSRRRLEDRIFYCRDKFLRPDAQ